MMCLTWTVLVFIYFSIGQTKENNSNLIFLHILFRHGDRSPLLLYPGDPNPPETWTEGLGKLTQLGRKQHYGLGKFLRPRYSDFVTSNPNEILVNSSSKDRCLRSALSNLASFFAPSHRYALDEHFGWQPIPVHYYSPFDKDKYLNMLSDCPRSSAELEKRLNSTEFLDLVNKFKPLIEVLREHGAFKDWTNYPWVLNLFDTVTIEKRHGLSLAPWIASHTDELAELSEILFNYSYDSEVQQRLRAGPILGKIIENMDEKIAGNLPDLKVQMFSAHDINILVLLQALKLFNKRWPPYCATLLLELHESRRTPGSREVRILLLNSTRLEDVTSHVPHLLQLEGCPEFCPLEQFRNITRHLIPDDWDVECRL